MTDPVQAPDATPATAVADPLSGSAAAAGGVRARFNLSTDAAQTWASVIALVVLVIAFSAISPQFRSLRNLQEIADAAAVLAVMASGISFILMLGAIDLSLPGVIGACTMAVSLLVANSSSGLALGIWGIGATILLGAALGATSGLLSTRLRIPSFMTTLGMSAIGLGIATILFGGVRPVILDPIMDGLATSRLFGFTQLTYLSLLALAIGWGVERHTRLGRYTRAIGGAEDIVRLSGVPVDRYKVLAFALAGAFYGLGAVMITARLGSGVVEAGAGMDFSAITAAVIGGTLLVGGRGGVLQSMIGVLVLTVLANGLILAGVSPYVQQAVEGVIVVVAVAAAAWPVRHRLGVVK